MADQIKCAYCGKATDKPVKGTIIFQNSRQQYDSWKKRYVWKKFVDRKTNDYCSGKCAGHDQMAHEG